MTNRSREMRFWMTIVRIVAHFTEGADKALLDAAGISLREKLLLKRLSDANGTPVRMVDLAHYLEVTKAAITKMIDRLEKAGLVARQLSAQDRRVVHPVITEAGRATLLQSKDAFYDYLHTHLFEHVSLEDMDQIVALLDPALIANDVKRTGPVMPPI